MQAKIDPGAALDFRTTDLLLLTTDSAEAATWLDELKLAGWAGHAEIVTSPNDLPQRCQEHPFHAVILDYAHPILSPALMPELLRRLGGHTPVILITDPSSETSALEGLAFGAFDYVFRSCLGRLPTSLQRAMEHTGMAVGLEGADDQLRETEDRFQILLDNVPCGVAVEGHDGILLANQALSQMLQANSPLDLLGRSLTSLLIPEHREQLLEQRRFRNPSLVQPISSEVTLSSFTGTHLETQITWLDIGYHGQPARLIIVHDRREQRRFEAALTSLATFAQDNPNPILMFTSDGRLTYFNEAAMEMSRSLGREHPAACIPPQTASLIETCLVTGQKRLHIHHTVNKRTFSWSFHPYRPSRVVHAYVQEMTDQVSLEEQLRYSHRLEAVGRLSAGIAHEFNNLLTVVQGQIQRLGHRDDLAAEARQMLQQSLHAVERGISLTRQLQAFGRRNQMEPTLLDLNGLLSEIHPMLQTTLGEDMDLELDLASELPAMEGDPHLLQQVIVNLAVNAREAMPQGGRLALGTSLVELPPNRPTKHPESRPGHFLRLTVSDTGQGIDPKTLPYLFEPLFSTKSDAYHSGLGLSTAYGIIKQHRGWIEVTSIPGSGTTFTIYWPVSRRWQPDHSDAPAISVRLAGRTVLLVEDDPEVRWIVRDMMKEHGIQVLEAASPIEALGLWREHKDSIDLLLTDMVMPTGIRGVELAESLLKDRPDLPVIYTSGYSIEAAARQLPVEVGVNFLQKPFNNDELKSALEHALSHSESADSSTSAATVE